jgi:DNA polymerase-3 subunit delta'
MTGEQVVENQLLQDLRSHHFSHAYLFVGPDLEKKKKFALFLAKALLCTDLQDGRPCEFCYSCRAFDRQAHPDFHLLEAQGTSLKIDQVREWQPFFGFRPIAGRNQVFMILAPERLTLAAANSLLKILEEPLPQTVFLLVTEEDRLLLPTIVSRCRVLSMRGSSRENAVAAPAKSNYTSLYQLLWKGKRAELLREIRLLGQERQQAKEVLEFLSQHLEQFYCAQKRKMGNNSNEQGFSLLQILESIHLLLQGKRYLEENLQVPLVLVTVLLEVQKKLQKIQT